MHKASPTEFLQSGLAIMLDRVTANLGYVARARTKKILSVVMRV